MVDSVNKLIANYQSKLTSTELEQFKSMPEDKQLAIAMMKTDKAAPTDLGALSNLDAKPGAKSSDGIFSKGQPPEENSTGLVIERKGAPYVDDKTGLPSTELPKEKPATAKTTQYAVQLGDSIEGVVKKSLKAQGIGTPDEKQLKEATEKFIADNGGVSKKGLIKQNKNGVKFLSAGSTVKLDGEVDVQHNKSAKQVSHEWAKKYGHASGKTEHKDGTHVDKTTKSEAVDKPADTKAVKGKSVNVRPTAEEIKGIEAKKGGYFIKNTKTGLISQAYKDEDGERIVETYDAKSKKMIQYDTYLPDKSSVTRHFEKDGILSTIKTRNADGSSETLYGTAHISVGRKDTRSDDFGRRIVTDIHGKETHYIAVRDESKPNQGETKWVIDKNPPKAKTAPAPKAASEPAAKVAAPAAPKPAEAKGKSVNVKPTAEEIKGIEAEKGGYFVKNTKTGNISQIYKREDGAQVIETYDAKTKKAIQRDKYFLDKVSVTSHFDKDGNYTAEKTRNADGSSETFYGNAHVTVGNRDMGNHYGRKIETDKNGHVTHYIAVRDESKPNQGETKWVIDKNPPKANAAPAPKAAAEPAAKVAAPAVPNPAEAKVKSVNVRPTAEEIKGIEAKKGGYFMKNTKTGLISQVYTEQDVQMVKTYDAKTKKIVHYDEYKPDGSSYSSNVNQGEKTSEIYRNTDGSRTIQSGTAGIFIGSKRVGSSWVKRTDIDKDGKETHYKVARDESKPNQGETKWVVDNNPPKAKTAPAPKATPAPAAKVAAPAAAPAPKAAPAPAAKAAVKAATPAPKPAAAVGKNITPSAEEIKDIAKQEGGRFIKNAKTGIISQVYSDKYGREVDTYDKNKKLVQSTQYNSDHSRRTYTAPNDEGLWTKSCETDKDGKKTYQVWKNGSWVDVQ